MMRTPLLKGSKFQYKYVPRLQKFTQQEEKKRSCPSQFRPVETIGVIVVAGQASMYAFSLWLIGRMLFAWFSFLCCMIDTEVVEDSFC